jgi:hypothetical protein
MWAPFLIRSLSIDCASAMNQLTELLAVDAAHIPYAVCGAWAVGLHGCPRVTWDLDLLILEEDGQRVLNAVEPLGYIHTAAPRFFNTGAEKELRVQRVSKAQEKEFLTLDLLMVTPILRPAWETRRIFAYEGKTIWVVSPEGLKHMKLLANREKDRMDLRNLGLLDA